MRNSRLGPVMAALAIASTSSFPTYTATMPFLEPINNGRRAEKDAEAERKASEKRRRRAEKRIGKMKGEK